MNKIQDYKAVFGYCANTKRIVSIELVDNDDMPCNGASINMLDEHKSGEEINKWCQTFKGWHVFTDEHRIRFILKFSPTDSDRLYQALHMVEFEALTPHIRLYDVDQQIEMIDESMKLETRFRDRLERYARRLLDRLEEEYGGL